jgi:hypothetical protein
MYGFAAFFFSRRISFSDLLVALILSIPGIFEKGKTFQIEQQ